MDNLRGWILRYKDILIYVIFGGLTTIVNYLVYFPVYNWFHASVVLSNALAWLAAVLFAFLTNKPFVFKSYDWSAKTVISELARFAGCRIASGFLETFSLWLCVEIFLWNGNVMKIIVSIFVVILNYISSKWLVFRS